MAGLLAVFATYWDEAWHTDVGRDSAWAAPHLLLYGSVAVVGLGVGYWGLRVLMRTRSVRATLAHPPLLAAGSGALGALAAAPIDTFWHEAYGRDAVLWSPPHMLVVLASTSLVLGVLAGLPRHARALRAAVGVLLLANVATVVFEYEADVPQFSEVLYLPLLLLVGLPTVWLIRELVPLRAPAATVVFGYVVLRLVVVAGLLSLGRSTPDLPIAVIGLAAVDLPLERTASRLGAATIATSVLAWAASALSFASPEAADVAVAAVPAAALGLIAVMSGSRAHLTAGAVAMVGVALVTVEEEPAEAHDPGQGTPVTSVNMRVRTSSNGALTISATAGAHCEDLTASRVVARRAGTTVVGRLDRRGECRFRGRLTLPDEGRWFLYVELRHAGSPAEAWVPVEAGSAGTLDRKRVLYVPADTTGSVTAGQVAAGGAVYAGGLALLYTGLRAATSARIRGSQRHVFQRHAHRPER